jgi:type III pantothenate kinase
LILPEHLDSCRLEKRLMPVSSQTWIGLAIGNSRLHWGHFQNTTLLNTWDTPHLQNGLERSSTWQDWQQSSPALAACLEPFPELLILSVVPTQTAQWLLYPSAVEIGLADIPLGQVYPTLGVDRAIALWGAGTLYGWPLLLIDAGTAITLTGADANGTLIGGAILPGLALQVRSLHAATAALPWIALPDTAPPRWAKHTETALQSGVVYGTVGGLLFSIRDWMTEYSDSKVVLTGGDGTRLASYLQAIPQNILAESRVQSLIIDQRLILKSIAVWKEKQRHP